MTHPLQSIGPFGLDLERMALLKDGKPLACGQKAFAIIKRLIEADGSEVSKAELMDAAWPGVFVEESNLTVQIAALRKLMGRAPDGGDWIVTVQRVGYRLAPAAVKPARSAAGVKPSIAVLPCENMTPESLPEFVADGLTDELTTALGKLREYFVIARSTMLSFKGKTADVRAIGAELGVQYLLQGSVRAIPGKLRIGAALINAANGLHLWGEHFDVAAEHIFAIHDEIISRVVARISPHLLEAERVRATGRPPADLTAWEFYVQALFLSARQSQQGSAEAMGLLEKALESDPAYAKALGVLAWLVCFRSVQGWQGKDEAMARARQLSNHAIEVDDSEPWAWIGRGCIGLSTRDNPLAVESMERAVGLNPSFALAHGFLGLAHSFGGRGDEALASLETATRLSPYDLFRGAFAQQFAYAHFQIGSFESALQDARRAHDLRPGHVYPMVIGAAAAGHLGKMASAKTLVDDLRAQAPDVTALSFLETAPYVLQADRERLVTGLRLAGLS